MNKQIQAEIAHELHAPARRNFKRRRVLTRGLHDLWQADLVEMIPYAKQNKNYKYMLSVVDVYTKFGWLVPVKTKSGVHVAQAMASILKSTTAPRNIQTDHGREFYNQHFAKLMQQYHINHYSTFSSVKAGVVERFNRTIKK
jgi:hypothetical protein